MSNLIIPRRKVWTQQPPAAVDIDWSAPITSGLISAILPSAKLFAGTSPSSGGFTSTNHLVTGNGVALGRNGGAWSLTQRPISGITTTSNMTMLAFMYGDSTVLTESNPVTTGQTVSAISSSICVGDGTTKALRYRIYLGAARYVGGSSVIPAKPTVVIGRQRYGVEQALFVGGEKDPITGSYTGPTSGVTHFGSYNGNASTRVLLSAIWARALSDDEIRSISANPWQIFAPPRSYLFSVTTLANAISLGLALTQFSAQTYQASAGSALGACAASAGAYAVFPAGVLGAGAATATVTPQAAFVSAVQSLQGAGVSLNSPDLDYILGALGNAVSLGIASISSTARAITYSTPGGTVHVVPYEFIGDYAIVHYSGNIAVDRSGALIIILR